MSDKALFAGLVIDENGQPLEMVITGDEAQYVLNDNGKLRVINGVNTGGTSLVVRADSNISSIDDLNGSRIATPGFGSIQDVIMRKMFEGFEIEIK